MEICRPSTLEEWIWGRNSSDPAAAAIVLITQYLARDAANADVHIIWGMAHVHSFSVFHRDLKPSKFFASYDEDGSDAAEGGDCGGISIFNIRDSGLSKLLACAFRTIRSPQFNPIFH